MSEEEAVTFTKEEVESFLEAIEGELKENGICCIRVTPDLVDNAAQVLFEEFFFDVSRDFYARLWMNESDQTKDLWRTLVLSVVEVFK